MYFLLDLVKKMVKEILIFGDISFHKRKFHYQKKSTFIIHDADVNKRLISNKGPFHKKNCIYFIS